MALSLCVYVYNIYAWAWASEVKAFLLLLLLLFAIAYLCCRRCLVRKQKQKQKQQQKQKQMASPTVKAAVQPVTNPKRNSWNSKPAQRNSGLFAWPALPTVEEDFQLPLEEWLDHHPPPELRQITIDCPSEVVRIIHQSLHKAQYTPVAQRVAVVVVEDTDADASKSNGRVKKRKDDDAASCLSQNSSAASASSSSRRRRSLNGAMAWLSTRGAAGERGVKKLVREHTASTTPATSECSSCFENMPTKQMVSLECQHKYCAACFLQLVDTAMRVETLFPPKCCLMKIPLKVVLSPLTADMKERYKMKAQEYAVSVSNRWYCPSASCGAWIPPSKIRRHVAVQKCHRCHISICSVCRGLAHETGDCPQETGLHEMLEEAERQGWRRCYSCHAMVELTDGCRHVTCKCKAEFCYACGARWPTCDCTEQDMTTRRAELTRRRAAREREAEQEAEIAAAIAAVEAMERREEEERIRREEQRRRREEEQAREREAQRLLEIDERIQQLQECLQTINKKQKIDLLNRQERQTQQLHAQNAARRSDLDKNSRVLLSHFEANLRSRMNSLLAAHTAELKRLQTQNEEEENEIIVKMSRLLKGRANIEEREVSILKHLRNTQRKKQDEVRVRHESEIADLNHKGSLELKGLRAGLSARSEEQERLEREAVREFVRAALIERVWFEKGVARREELLEEYRSELVSGRQAVINEGID
ncbi:hypothetical protein VTN77DRAFT_8490 [Rasamsonia byssochlamydoides]|uniref:uncharacterized protein n=1 Tax=Rasamsonia byssochlamydoides TaxID=89139 RepID=UPI0037442381